MLGKLYFHITAHCFNTIKLSLGCTVLWKFMLGELYFHITADINELISKCQSTKCAGRSSKKKVCGKGRVRMDDWLNSTLSFQRSLSANTPLNYGQWIGTHNSFNNRADG